MNLLLSCACVALGSIACEAAERVSDYASAMARATASGKDIVVYQRGSDWNRLGEQLYSDVWMKPELAKAVGDGFILVDVDHPELVGGPASSLLEQLTHPNLLAAPCELVSVTSSGGATFKAQPDGDFLASGDNPAQDTITLKLIPQRDGNVVRIDFPRDATLPGNGPGRASNGNFAIQEVEIATGFNRGRPRAAWASDHEGDQGAWQLADGVVDQHSNHWNAAGYEHQKRTLLLVLPQRVNAKTELVVRLICRTDWGQHVPGCIRASVVPDPSVESAVLTVAAAKELAEKNKRFTWRDDDVPRVALLDSKGRPVSSEDKLRIGLTTANLAARIRQLQQLRLRRDELWAKAERIKGPAKAEMLRQSLDLLGLANSTGHDKAYAFVHEEIRAADPKDESGALRWLQFSSDPRDVPEQVSDALKLVSEKRYQDALTLLDRELADPRNRILDHDRIQRIMLGRFQVYRQWPGNEEKRFDELRKIAALDSTTYHGVGATGYMNMHFRTPTPEFVCYGWGASQVKSGVNTWNLKLGASDYLDHAGPYDLRIHHNGGRDAVRIRSVELVDEGKIVCRSAPDEELAPNGEVKIAFTVPSWNANRKPFLRVVLEAKEGKTDCGGRIDFEPLLEAPKPQKLR